MGMTQTNDSRNQRTDVAAQLPRKGKELGNAQASHRKEVMPMILFRTPILSVPSYALNIIVKRIASCLNDVNPHAWILAVGAR